MADESTELKPGGSEDEATSRVTLFNGRPLDTDSQDYWRFRIRALNGEILAVSEPYTRRADALRGLEDLRHALEHPLIDAGD